MANNTSHQDLCVCVEHKATHEDKTTTTRNTKIWPKNIIEHPQGKNFKNEIDNVHSGRNELIEKGS